MSKIAKVLLALLAIVIFAVLVILAISVGVLLISSFSIYTGYATRWLFKEESIGIYEASLLNLISLALFAVVASFFGLWTKISRIADQVSAAFYEGDEDEDEDFEDHEDYDEYDEEDHDVEDYGEEDEDEEGERERKTIKPDWIERKPSRNQKCPCGSGKKFKNCCGRYL